MTKQGATPTPSKRFSTSSTSPMRLRQQGAISAAKRQSSLNRADDILPPVAPGCPEIGEVSAAAGRDSPWRLTAVNYSAGQ